MRGHSLGSSVREKIMRPLFKAILFAAAVLFAALLLKPGASVAGDIILSHNTGSENAVFFIENEPSLVINGFDLTPYTAQFPVGLDAVSISVSRAAPITNIELVVYQDANGGSPVDATLIHRQPVTINRSGFHRFQLSEAAIVTEPVVWVGFYLPVGFRFHADVSGPSVLTYWAWTPGAAFDISSLASAPVLGPGDGTDPVSIDMQGIARITAEMRPLFHQEMESDTLLGHQLVAEGEQDTSAMGTYPHCGGLLHDPEDISVTSSSSFTIRCEVKSEFEAPTEVVNPDGRLLDLQRAGHLYKLEAQIPQAQRVHGAVNILPVPVTHCMSIQPGDLEQAVIAEGRGIPERWHVLPSVRFGEMVCAEITTASYLSYFLPRGAGAPPNVNLALGWTTVNPHPIECGLPAYVSAPVVNTGQSWFSTVSGNVKFIIENIHVRSGTITGAVEISVETSQLGPGMRHLVHFAPIYVTSYVNELHRLQVRADFDNQIQETNENDNVWFTEYILSNAQQSDRCFDAPWLTATPTAPYLVEGFCFVDLPREVNDDGRILIRYSDACQIDEFKQGGMTEQSGDWQHTVRGCDILVRTEVVGQEVTVRWSNQDNTGVGSCQAGRFRQYYQTVEVGGEEVRQLVIDHDPPPPTLTTDEITSTAAARLTQTSEASFTPDSAISAPRLISGNYNAEARRVEFKWEAVTGANAYNFRYGRAGHVLREGLMEITGLEHTLEALDVIRGADYVWEVQAKISDSRLGPWARSTSTFNVPKLPAPRMLMAVNTPFEGIEPSNKFGLAWGVVNEAETPVAQYELQWRRVGEAWPASIPIASTPAAEISVASKSERHEWRVQARGGGEWAEATLPFSTQDLTSEAVAAIRETVTRIPSVNLMVDRVTTTPSTIALRLSWNTVLDATAQYNYQWRVLPSGDWQPVTPERVIVAPPAVAPTRIHPIGAANVGVRHEGRVNVVIGVAEGRWEETSEPTPPPAPMNLRVSSADSNNVRFEWDAVAGADSYKVRYRRAGTSSWAVRDVSSGTDVTVSISSSDRTNSYQWQVQVIKNNVMDGLWSDDGPWTFS